MNVGDLVMWIGTDQDHGCLGIVMGVNEDILIENHYSVMWYDGTKGTMIFENELRKVEDANTHV